MKIESLLDFLMNEPYKLAHMIGFDRFKEYPHNKWIRTLVYSDEYEYTLQGHRGSYKTTTLAVAIALRMILYPDKNILLFRKTDASVKDFKENLKKILVTDEIQEIVQTIHGIPLIITTENQNVIDTNLNQSIGGDPQFRATGINSSITGLHADYVVTDDIITTDDRSKYAIRQRTKAVYQELHNIVNRDGVIRNLGTPWHENDAFELMSEPDKYDYMETGMISDDEIKKLKTRMTASLFSANYELKHTSDKEKLFNDPVIDDGANTHRIYDGYAHIDASYGGKDGTAFTVINRKDDKIYVFGKLYQEHVDNVLDDIEYRRKLYRAGTIYTETNADKGYLDKQLQEPSQTYHESMNKNTKIATHLKKVWTKIIFINDTDPDYIEQIVDYMEGADHDDAPDSLASIIRETEQSGGVATFRL